MPLNLINCHVIQIELTLIEWAPVVLLAAGRRLGASPRRRVVIGQRRRRRRQFRQHRRRRVSFGRRRLAQRLHRVVAVVERGGVGDAAVERRVAVHRVVVAGAVRVQRLHRRSFNPPQNQSN